MESFPKLVVESRMKRMYVIQLKNFPFIAEVEFQKLGNELDRVNSTRHYDPFFSGLHPLPLDPKSFTEVHRS